MKKKDTNIKSSLYVKPLRERDLSYQSILKHLNQTENFNKKSNYNKYHKHSFGSTLNGTEKPVNGVLDEQSNYLVEPNSLTFGSDR